jgi:L-serine dehydratase
MGLMGEKPESVDPVVGQKAVDQVITSHRLQLPCGQTIQFNYDSDLLFNYQDLLPEHSNGMRFIALDASDEVLLSRNFYSVGGGFVHDEISHDQRAINSAPEQVKYPFKSARELASLCREHGLSISTLVLENETAWRTKEETMSYLMQVWHTMRDCIERGCHTEGILPGGLNVKRRAAHLYRKLQNDPGKNSDPLCVMDWVNLFALAVNEENAAGGRVVTAPTNGAAGIIPAVLSYYHQFKHECDDQTVVRYLLTAGAVGMLFKENASISGAEVGCQGEVGVACSMAAAGLAEILGGTVEQCQVAAEIGMEHNLGLTCDPVGGLVQIPCIERNAMAAVTAINAARLALHGDGSHKISLDKVILTMKQTGADMRKQYKETAQGGLAVNLIEC